MPPNEVWLDVAGVRLGLRGTLDIEKALGPRFNPFLSEPDDDAVVIDVERATVKPADAPSVVVSSDGVAIKVGTVQGNLSADGKKGRLKLRNEADLAIGLEAFFSHILVENDGVLVKGYLVEERNRGHVLFGIGADRAAKTRPAGSRLRGRGAVAVRFANGLVAADPTPFTGESAGAAELEDGSGGDEDSSSKAPQPVGVPCIGLYRIEAFGPDRFEPLPPREGLRILLEDVIFHDDDTDAAGHLLDLILEVVALVGVSRVIGKAVDSFWVSVCQASMTS